MKNFCDGCGGDAVHCVSFIKGKLYENSELDDNFCERILLCDKCCERMQLQYMMDMVKAGLKIIQMENSDNEIDKKIPDSV